MRHQHGWGMKILYFFQYLKAQEERYDQVTMVVTPGLLDRDWGVNFLLY